MNTAEYSSFEHAKKATSLPDGQDSAFIQYCKMFSTTASDGFYALDVQKKGFSYIKPDDLFLCGHSVEEAMKLGYDFYAKIVDPKDLSLWMEILKAISLYLRNSEEKRDQIDSFSCTIRLLHTSSFTPDPLSIMVHQRMTPVWQDDEPRYVLCSVRSSTINKSGNLYLHSKDGILDEEYNFTTRRWKQREKIRLTEREISILMLAKQGKNSSEIASDLCKGRNTIQNQINALFKKLGVHSMQEGIDIASHYGLLCPQQDMRDNTKAPDGKKQGLFFDHRLQRIQQYLNQQKSIREIAWLENTPESTIRSWIKKRMLIKL